MSKLNTVVPVTDASYGSLAPQVRETAPPPPAADQPDVRLIIEEDDRTGAFVYKTMDRRTGEVIQQFPREEILRLKEQETYQAGAVIDARA